MNRRTLIASTPLALAPRLSYRLSSDTEKDTTTDPPLLEDILVDDSDAPNGWILDTPASPPVKRGRNDGAPVVNGGRSQRHPRTDHTVASVHAERRFTTNSEVPTELEHLDVSLEVASIGEHADYDDRSGAVRALHEVMFAMKTNEWESLSTGWVDAEREPAADRLHQRSVASIRKPLCAVPSDIELSTDRPVIEMAIAVMPLAWGVAVVTGTIADPNKTGQTRRLVTQFADRTVTVARSYPTPAEAQR